MKISKIINIKNRRASFEYIFIETFTVGIVLQGTEIKSIRLSNVQISDSYCYINNGEMFVNNLHISPYELGTYNNHEPDRVKKLLIRKKELRGIEKALKEQSLTLIPTRLFTTEKGLVKLEIVLAKGKKLHDKRESLKEKDLKREINDY